MTLGSTRLGALRLSLSCLLGATALLACSGKSTPAPKTTPDTDTTPKDVVCGDETGCADVAQTTCDDGEPATASSCVDQAAYLSDLTFIAAPRSPGSAHHAAVRKHIVDRLKALKFKVTEQNYGVGTNVIGERVGTAKADEVVIIGAHYDGVPNCAAADDNGTGVAGALQAAAALARYDHERTLQVVFWDEEERGLTGSFHHAAQLAKAGRKVVTVYDYEMIGYATKEPNTQELPSGFDVIFAEAGKYWWDSKKTGDFIAVVYGHKSKAAAQALIAGAKKAGIVALPVELTAEYMASATFADLRRSDHTSYWAEGYPAMMITDTANFRNTHYHCNEGADSVDRLDHAFAVAVVKGTVAAAVGLLRADGGAAVGPEVATCDLDKQDCPADKKCTPWGEGDRWLPTCMPIVDKPVGLYAFCSRTNNKLGDDTCDVGLFCSPWGTPRTDPIKRHCVRPCTKDASCGKGEACVMMAHRTYGGGVVPHFVGLCLKTCDPFLTTSCGAEMMCSAGFVATETLKDTHTCMWAGDKAAGAKCSATAWGECQPGLDCVYGVSTEAATCRAPCDTKHPCKAGTCQPDADSASAGLGHCFP